MLSPALSSFLHNKQESSLTAKNIVIGTKPDSQDTPATKATAASAKVELGKLGAISGVVSVYDGGLISAQAAVGDIATSKIGGDSLTVGKGGKIDIAAGKGLQIESKTLSVTNGGKLALGGTDSKLAFTGTTLTLKDGALEGNKGTIGLGAVSNDRNVTLNVDSATFNEHLFKSSKVNLNGTKDQGGTLTINVEDASKDASLDLVTSGLVKDSDGKLGDNFTSTSEGPAATVVIKANKGTLASDSFSQTTFKSVDFKIFNDLTVGKTDAGFTINAGNLTVKNKLTVSGSKAFTVAGSKSLTSQSWFF